MGETSLSTSAQAHFCKSRTSVNFFFWGRGGGRRGPPPGLFLSLSLKHDKNFKKSLDKVSRECKSRLYNLTTRCYLLTITLQQLLVAIGMVRAVEKLEVKFLLDTPAFVYANMFDMVTSGIRLTPYYRTGLLGTITEGKVQRQ